MTKVFCTYFPDFEEIHLHKDPGQIPYRFSRLGFSSIILINKPVNEFKDVAEFNISILKPYTFLGYDYGIIRYMLFNSRKISVFNIFHIDNWISLWAAYLYKLFNPKGFVYLKMDNCHSAAIYPWENIFDKKIKSDTFLSAPKASLKWKIKKFLIKHVFIYKVDLFSVEDVDSKCYYENKYRFLKDKIIVAFNGHTIDLFEKETKVNSFTEKRNILIAVGRLGTFPKNTLTLLKGFAATAHEHNWNLELAGPIDPKFIAHKIKFFEEHPDLSGRIIFLGNLAKPKLFELYNRSKILLLPSNHEGFAIVYSEASFFGNAIITSPFTSISHYVLEHEFGLLVEPKNHLEIGHAISKLINNNNQLEMFCNNSKYFANSELNWDKIVKNIYDEINARI